MEKLSFVTIASTQPSVSFDIAIREKIPQGMVLDFDYDEYRAFCQVATPHQPDAASSAKILVESKSPFHGSYYPGKRISVTYNDVPEKTNASIRHESSHYFDYLDGRPGCKVVSSIADLSLRSLRIAMPTALGIGVLSFYPNAPGWMGVTAGIVAGAPLAGSFMYYLRPGERRARHIEEDYPQYNPLRLRPASDFQNQ